MNANPSQSLAVGVSARALFDLGELDEVLRDHGRDAFRRHQIERADEPLPPGPGLDTIRRLQQGGSGGRGVEIVVFSDGVADASLRILSSARQQDLELARAAFTGGDPLAPYLQAFRIDLFLSTELHEAASAMDAGTAAALIRCRSEGAEAGPLRIAVEGRAVARALEGSDESPAADEGGAERGAARLVPRWVRALSALQRIAGSDPKLLRTALVSSEGGAAHAKILRALHDWDVQLDQAFLSGDDAAEVLDAVAPDIVFDLLGHKPSRTPRARAGDDADTPAERGESSRSFARLRLRG